MLDNKKRNKDKDQVENNKESELLKDAIKEVFEHALLEKNISEDRFNEVIKNKNLFLEIFSPWHKEDEDGGLIKNFVDQIDKQDFAKDFSWLNILDKDRQWEESGVEEIKKEVKDKSKHVNMRYQIPTHFHGDIDNAVLFYCMENPRGYLGDYKDSVIDKEFQGETLNEFYVYSADKRLEESKRLKEIVRERYQLNDVTTDLIKKIIYSDAKDETPLRCELDNMFDEKPNFFQLDYILKKNKRSKKPVLSEKYYYLAQFYAQLLEINGGNLSKYNIESECKEKAQAERDKAIKISEKICNVEIYPFSSSEPKLNVKGIGNTILLNSALSRLGVYIVLRRIYRYLNDEAEKPVFLFRKYDRAWEILFNEKNQSFSNKLVLSLLEKGFFYCQTGSMGGGITDGNVISVPNFRTVDRENTKEFEKTKLNDFNSIKSLLTKVEN